jgi:BAG domain/IQ calmodulin-binding motif
VLEKRSKKERSMDAFYGYPRRNYSFYPRHSDVNPNQYLNPYYNSNPSGDYYFNPYHNSNSRLNQYRNPYNNPNPSPQPTLNPTPKPKAVSIPIHFVNSDSGASQLPTQPPASMAPPRPSPEMASVKLQKVIRGYLVRKNCSIVRKIEAEAEAIEEEIARDKMVLAKELKARIRIGEMLMNLLFRLDSVRGVRDYRKKVIRKVISLQELVDSISARGDSIESDTIEVGRSDLAVDYVQFTGQDCNSPQTEESKVVEAVDSMEESPIDLTNSIDTNKCAEQTPSSSVEDDMVVAAVNSMESPIEPITSTETSQMGKLGEKQNVDEEFTEAQELDEVCDPTEALEFEETVERSNPVDQAPESSQVVTCNEDKNETEMKGMRDVMERVVVESERMKNLMGELCQSSARQWRLMEGLVDRVQRLEREVTKMERRDKKKRKGNGKKSGTNSKKCESLL